MLIDKWPAEKIIEEAYLGTVSRLPGEAEKNKLTKLLADASENDKRPVLEDIYWALLSSKEFLFNH